MAEAGRASEQARVGASGRGQAGRPRAPTIGRLLIVAGLLATLTLIVIWLAVGLYRVDGDAMAPTFRNRDYLVINRFAYARGRRPARGDLIVYRPPGPSRSNSASVKRVIALPGETVSVRAGTVYINDIPLAEPYTLEPARYQYPAAGGAYTVPAGAVFVLGDNRNNSRDSHAFGPLALDSILGEVVAIVAPAARAGFLPVQHYAVANEAR